MRAGRLDVLVETGARWVRDVQLVAPGTPTVVAAMTPGGRYYMDGVPVRVHAVRELGNGTCRVELADGLYGDPVLTLPADALVAPAVPVAAVEATAAFSYPDGDTLASTPIPVTISADGSTLTLALDAAATSALADSVGAYSWDLYVRTAEFDWQRTLEGTFTVVKGDAR